MRCRVSDRGVWFGVSVSVVSNKVPVVIVLVENDTILTIADRRANKTAEQHRTKTQLKLTRLQRTKDKKRQKPDDNWVRNISSRRLDKTEPQVLSYGLKHSVTPKRIPTEAIVSSVEAVLSRQRELSESAKDNIRSRIASTVQSASLPDSNLTKDERQALKRLKTRRKHCHTPR